MILTLKMSSEFTTDLLWLFCDVQVTVNHVPYTAYQESRYNAQLGSILTVNSEFLKTVYIELDLSFSFFL